MGDTHIEWTDRVWNPTTGCDRVSPGCDHCYALTMAKRLKGMGQPKYQNDGDPRTSGPGFLATEHESELDAPLRWRKPAKVFVNSMSDLFHDRIDTSFIIRVFAVMALARRHTFQVLTKRHARMRSLLSAPSTPVLIQAEMHREKWLHGVDAPAWRWPLPNVWLGVSVEDQKWADIRIPALLDTLAAVRFLSCEPLLGPVDLSRWLGPVDWPPCFDEHPTWTECARCIQPEWVIVGGESGPGARPMHPDWARSLRDQSTAAGIPFHFKQWGEWAPHNVARPTYSQLDAHGTHWDGADGATARVGKKAAGRFLDGRTWDEFPEPHRAEVTR